MSGVYVNDVHSRLNRTRVREECTPSGVAKVKQLVHEARQQDLPMCPCGSRHAMGGQQFGTDALLVDMTGMDRILDLDEERGLVTVEAGIEWPQLIRGLHARQSGGRAPWTIRQKQTGADRLSLGGALSANVHGRGLAMKPIVEDVEAFELIDPHGERRFCSRHENPELFRTAIGGYGLFGVITTITLRLERRHLLRRDVKVTDVDDALECLETRAEDGHRYGDFQFSIVEGHEGFLRAGILATYEPADDADPPGDEGKTLSEADWLKMVHMAHENDPRLFDQYADYYRSTHGQTYYSDTHQLSTYVRDYHNELSAYHPRYGTGSEMITEIYVPRSRLVRFMADARAFLSQSAANVIYGTVRLIKQDDETALPWARDDYACIIFNLHMDHDDASLERAKHQFRTLIDLGLKRGGSFYLTYHNFATLAQVRQAYPSFDAFVERKQRFDPAGRFQSDWYRHYKQQMDACAD